MGPKENQERISLVSASSYILRAIETMVQWKEIEMTETYER